MLHFQINPHSGVPVYRQMIDQVKYYVASDALKAGDQLPSIRELAQSLAINPTTVVRVYAELEHEGVIEIRHGKGAFVTASSRRMTAAGRDTIPRMPRYMIVRSFDVEENEMPAVGRRSRELVETEFPEVVWEHSHVVVDDDGTVRTYCVYEAPSEQVVREHADQLGRHVIEVLAEIAGDVTPADFPAV